MIKSNSPTESAGLLQIHTTKNPVQNTRDSTWYTFRDSNPGPTDYESVALPTELKVHI